MRDLLLIVGSSSPSIVIPPNSTPFPNPSHHSTKPNPKPSLPTNTKLSPSKRSPPPPLLYAARWDSTARRRNRLKYYADLASKLAEHGRFQDFLMIAESVVISGRKRSQFVSLLNIKLVSTGISLMLKEGNISGVVEALSGLQKKLGISPLELFDGPAKEALARQCRRIVNCSGELEEIVTLMETLAGFRFSVKKLVEPSEIIKLCVNKRNPDAAVRYACLSSDSHIMLCAIILEFGKKRDLASALTVFEESKQSAFGTNMYAYRTMIDVCGLCGDYLKSRSIYEELLAQKIAPNIYVINSLMNVNSQDFSYTLHIYKQMQNFDVTADMTSYNILLKSCCLAARVDLAQDIYREVQHLESIGALKLDVFTYSTVIKVFADAKMWEMALAIKEDMVAAGVTPNTVTWSSLISACANAGLVEHTINLFDKMLMAGCQPNYQCFNILLHACVEACQYDRAFRLFKSWKGIGFQKDFGEDYERKKESNVSVEHVLECCKATVPNSPHGPHLKICRTTIPNWTSNSRSLHFAMKVPFTPTTSTYNILMKACGTDYYRAKALMDEMKTVCLSPNHISWSILIDICGSSRNVKGALQILKSMREAGIRPDVVAYTAAIKVCVESKNMKFALSLFAEMKRYQIQPNFVTYNTLLRARSRYGSLLEVQQCLAIYLDMRKTGYKANDYYLKQLVEEWCEGVIQDNNQNKGQFSPSSRSDLGGSQSLLLEKVAALLQKSHIESIAIDLKGLTKVEARIVVLAVLRMIKENYIAGDLMKDDLLIILSIQEARAETGKCESEVKDAIIKLLEDELGLEIQLAGRTVGTERKINLENPLKSYRNLEETLGRTPTQLKTPTRRPAVLQRLKVTRESLYHWLQKKNTCL